MSGAVLRVGVAGLGGAGLRLLRDLGDARGRGGGEDIVTAAAADVRAEARRAFERDFRGPVHRTVEALCADPGVDAVYVATPSHLHCEHALLAIGAGKHVVCEKPLATRLEDCDRMIEAARCAGVVLMQGHSKVLEAPVRAMRAILDGDRLGAVFHLDILCFNDWMRRPRLAAELETANGGGVVLRQGPILVDLARHLAGGSPRTVRAGVGRHARGLGADGSFSARIDFAGGASAALSFNGYGYLDSAALLAPEGAPPARRTPRTGAASEAEKYRELRLDRSGSEAGTGTRRPSILAVVHCERGVIVHAPTATWLHDDGGRDEVHADESAGRAAALFELREALRAGRAAFPDGVWARTTLEVCLAIHESARLAREVRVGDGA